MNESSAVREGAFRGGGGGRGYVDREGTVRCFNGRREGKRSGRRMEEQEKGNVGGAGDGREGKGGRGGSEESAGRGGVEGRGGGIEESG